MSASFDSFQVLYSDGAPASPIRLGQLLVDESEANPFLMLKICTDLSPLVYSSIVAAGGPGVVQTLVPGLGILVDATDPANPIVSVDEAADFTWTAAHTWTGADPLVIQGDNKELRFGAGGDDMAIYHDGTNNRIDSNTGTFNVYDSATLGLTVGAGFVLVPSDNSPTVRVGGAFTGMGSAGSTQLNFYINNASAEYQVLRLIAARTQMTGTSDATQPQSMFSHYTADFGTERGYWGYPTTSSDTMILRNIVGDNLLFRVSDNVTRIAMNTVGVGFNNTTPIAPPNYTVTNPTVDRAISGNGVGETTATLSAVLGTLISDLIAMGLLS